MQVGWAGKEESDSEEEAKGWKEIRRYQDQPVSASGKLYVSSLLLGSLYAVNLVEGQQGKECMGQFMLERTEPPALRLSKE